MHVEEIRTICLCDNCSKEVEFTMTYAGSDRIIKLGTCECNEELQEELAAVKLRETRLEQITDALMSKCDAMEDKA
jgi:hypothetical protein